MSAQPLQYAERAPSRGRWLSAFGGAAGLFATFALVAALAWVQWRGQWPNTVMAADRVADVLPLLSIATGLLAFITSAMGLAGNWRGGIERMAFGTAILYWGIFGAVMLGLV